MRHLYKLVSVFCLSLAMFALTGCEGGDLYNMDNPDWIQEKIDSINAAKNNNTEEEVLEGMQEDVYTIGKTDFTSSFWSAWSKYYVVPDGEKWNAQFNLNINSSDNTYYKNFALVITNDNARGETNYKEYGVIRFDATNDTAKYNSIWGNNIYFKYSNSNMLLDPVDNKDANLQKLGGKITLTVDRSQEGKFFVKITNGKVTKTYNQPFALPNLNTDATNKNIRCFVVPDGSYIDFLSTNIVPEGGCTSALDKAPVSMVLNNVPDEVDLGTSLDDAMANVSATVTYEEGVTKTIPASELMFSAIPDMDKEGDKTLIVIYNKTFKDELAEKPIVANGKFKVVQGIASISVTTKPTRTTYYFYTSAATNTFTDRTLAFDPTGLEVTATYNNGTTGVINNSKLSFSAVPAEVGNHVVTITTRNGKTAKVKVNVAESTVTAVTPSPLNLGAGDNTTAWWTVFTNDIKIPVGETYSTTFSNYSGSNNWSNFIVILRNTARAEYAVLRSDNYGWGDGYAACTHNGTQGDWATWLAAMKNAKVTVYITNCNNGRADVQAVMTGNDEKVYTQYYLGINTVDPNDLNFAFTVDNSHLVFENTTTAKKYRSRHR